MVLDYAKISSAPLKILINGQIQGLIEVADRSLHYGDGLFETIRVRDGRLCRWPQHDRRLAFGAMRLGIPRPEPDPLLTEALSIAHGLDDGVLKIILTRGIGGRGYRPPPAALPQRILLTYPLPPAADRFREAGVAVRYCRTFASVNPALAGIKHLNRLDSVLARHEWDDPAIVEGLMFDPFGALVGGTMTNVFLWDGERFLTPSLERSGIAGTLRALLIEMATASGIDCIETQLERGALEQASGLLLTNAIAGVWPVRELAGRSFVPARLPLDLLRAVHQAARTPG